MKIGGKTIESGKPIFIVAEMSANHGGNLEVALETVKAAKRAGADAIKLQTYTADTITVNSSKEDFQIKEGTLWDGRILYDLYNEAHTPWDWHTAIFEAAKEEGLVCFSSPFDKSSVDFLENLQAPAYKIASFEITDIPLIRYAASKGKPIIISTGIADEQDIRLAVDACKAEGNNDIILLQCTSSYPAPIEDANLNMIEALKEKFNVSVGLSDHTKGIVAPTLAAGKGVVFIEKHFILNKEVGGPDASFSLDEMEFTEMVSAVRDAEKALGKVDFSISERKKNSRIYSRSLYVVEDVKVGDIISERNVRSIRPGYGLHPKFLIDILGKKFNQDVEKATPIAFSMIEGINTDSE